MPSISSQPSLRGPKQGSHPRPSPRNQSQMTHEDFVVVGIFHRSFGFSWARTADANGRLRWENGSTKWTPRRTVEGLLEQQKKVSNCAACLLCRMFRMQTRSKSPSPLEQSVQPKMLWINFSSSSTGSGVSWATAMRTKKFWRESIERVSKMGIEPSNKGEVANKICRYCVTPNMVSCCKWPNFSGSGHETLERPLRPELTKQQRATSQITMAILGIRPTMSYLSVVAFQDVQEYGESLVSYSF